MAVFEREGKITLKMQKTSKIVSVRPDEGIIREMVSYVRVHHIRKRDYLFYSRPMSRHRHVTRQHVWRVFRSVGHVLDIMNIGSHTMRRTFAQAYYRDKASLSALQSRMGHHYISSTLCYLMENDRLVVD